MTNPTIAKIKCPACDDENADVRESGKHKRAYVMCAECGYQGFSRGDKSNAAIRAKARPAAQSHSGGDAGGAGAGKEKKDGQKKTVNFWRDDIFDIGPKAAGH